MTPRQRRDTIPLKEMDTMTADYNGWADQREEEREALDQLEITRAPGASTRGRLPVLRRLLLRAAVREILAPRVNRTGSGADSCPGPLGVWG